MLFIFGSIVEFSERKAKTTCSQYSVLFPFIVTPVRFEELIIAVYDRHIVYLIYPKFKIIINIRTDSIQKLPKPVAPHMFLEFLAISFHCHIKIFLTFKRRSVVFSFRRYVITAHLSHLSTGHLTIHSGLKIGRASCRERQPSTECAVV